MSHFWFITVDWNIFILKGVPFILSFISAFQTYLAGNLHKRTWQLGLANQLLWLAWIIYSETWGFLPLNFMLWYLYAKNHFKWKSSNLIKE